MSNEEIREWVEALCHPIEKLTRGSIPREIKAKLHAAIKAKVKEGK